MKVNSQQLHLIDLPCIISPVYAAAVEKEYDTLVIESYAQLADEVGRILALRGSYVLVAGYTICGTCTEDFTLTSFEAVDQSFVKASADQRKKRKKYEVNQGYIKNLAVANLTKAGVIKKGLSKALKERLFTHRATLIGRSISVKYNIMHDQCMDFELVSLA